MAGVYLSYPFCAQKCSYCNFASGVFSKPIEASYYAALCEEIRRNVWAWPPETLYAGGGTPSAMESSAFQALLSLIPGRPWREATLEAAPGSVTAEKAQAWAAAGIDRISLGVQSFVSAELARTGRRHDADIVASDVQTLRQWGLHNINIDLIAGLPAQSAATWEQSLDWIARLAPPHVSVYMLEVDEDSRLGREILSAGTRYGAASRPSDDLVADLYERAVERLAEIGLRRYEISNFAVPGYQSCHNLKYWKLEPYVGFGADAHSFDGRLRWHNPESVEAYLRGGPRDFIEARPSDERFFVGLRLAEGIQPEPEEARRFREPIRRFLSEGLLESQYGTLRLTNRGVLLSNEVFQEFLT